MSDLIERISDMKSIVEWSLKERNGGVGFRLLFDDNTWTDTSWVMKGEKLKWLDDEPCSELEYEIGYSLFDLENGAEDFTEDLLKSCLIAHGFELATETAC